MTNEIDRSSRPTKRRKITYGARRSAAGLLETSDSSEMLSKATSSQEGNHDQRTVMAEFDHDSAYGSKDDSVIEDDGLDESSRQLQTEHLPDASIHQPTAIVRHRRQLKETRTMVAGGRITSITTTSETAETDQERHQLKDQAQGGTATLESAGDRSGGSPALRSSGRQRKRPRRFSDSPEKPQSKSSPAKEASLKTLSNEVVQPKSILTPSKKGSQSKPRKSVVFDQEEKAIEKHFGFKDIETTGKTTSTKRADESQSPRKREYLRRNSNKASSSYQESDQTAETELPDDNPLIEQIIEVQRSADTRETTAPDLPSFDFDPILLELKKEVLLRLTSAQTPRAGVPQHLRTQYDELHNLLSATIHTGESNSMLLLGSRGCGKTHLLNIALDSLSSEFGDDFLTVRLNGMYQTDDKLALRETWRQLGREMAVDETETEAIGGSYADTMASLLALLSHRDEIDADLDGPVDTDNSQRISKSVLFILDEFDLFTTHPRQTLLYNLFDIAQSRKAPIAVIGCSTRMDVVECLEKRVKSRFSHRWLHIPGVSSLAEFNDCVKSVLRVPTSTLDLGTQKEDMRRCWNNFIESTFVPSDTVQTLIKRIYLSSKSVADVLAALYLPVATIDFSSSNSITQLSEPASSAVLLLLPNLPTLHLSLLVSASRLDTIHHLSSVNFNLAYAQYRELIARSRLQLTASGAVAVGAGLRQWGREVARAAWDDLSSFGALVYVSGSVIGPAGASDLGVVSANAGIAGAEGASVRMWRVDVTLDELTWALKEKIRSQGRIQQGVGASTAVGAAEILIKWCREV